MGTDCPVYWCTIYVLYGPIRHDTGPYGVPMGRPGARRDPTGADRRRHCRNPLNMSLPGLGGPQLLSTQAVIAVLNSRVRELLHFNKIGQVWRKL